METIVPLLTRKRDSADLLARDGQRLEPLLRVRRRSKWPLVEVVKAGLYGLKNGGLWRELPASFPLGYGVLVFCQVAAGGHT